MFTYIEYNPKVFLLCKGKKKETIFMFPFSDRVGSTGKEGGVGEGTLDGSLESCVGRNSNFFLGTLPHQRNRLLKPPVIKRDFCKHTAFDSS